MKVSKLVETFSGNLVVKTKCRKIKGVYYEMGVDCFKMSDGKFHRIDNGLIDYDHELKRAVFKGEANLYQGVIGVKDKKELIFGSFSPNVFKNVNLHFNNRIHTVISEDVLNNTDFTKHPESDIFSYRGNVSNRGINAEALPYTCDSMLSSAVGMFRQGAYLRNNKVDIRSNKVIRNISPKFRFGMEFETSSGFIGDNNSRLYGLMSLKDGSLRKPDKPLPIEYVTIPYSREDLLISLPEVTKLLNKYCTFDNTCSFHVHISGIDNSKMNTVALWMLISKLQRELFAMFPKYKTSPQIIGKSKNYCKPLEDLNYLIPKQGVDFNTKLNILFSHLFRYLSGGMEMTSDFNRTTLRHPQSSKWNISSRYHLVNFVTFLFSNKKTVEFRVHTGTFNYDYILNWIFICSSIVSFVEKYATMIVADHEKDYTLREVLGDIYPKEISEKLFSYIEYRKSNRTDSGSREEAEDSNKLNSELCLI